MRAVGRLRRMRVDYMSIRIQDYGTVPSSSYHGGMVPMGALNGYADGVRDLMSGAISVVGAGGDFIENLHQVQAAGVQADVARGVEQFRSDVFSELNKRDDYENWESSWKDAIETRLPEYLPTSLDEINRSGAGKYVEALREKGGGEVRRMAQLAQIKKARGAWEQNIAEVSTRGDQTGLARHLNEGRGVFLSEKDVPQFVNRVQERADWLRMQNEVATSPLETTRILREGRHEISADEDKATELLARSEKAGKELKERYGIWMLDLAERGGIVEDSALSNAQQEGLLTPGQVRNYEDAVARERQAVWTMRAPKANPADLCNWRRRVDERDVRDEPALMVDLVCSGLPRNEVRALATRLKKTSLVPDDVRKNISHELTALYHNGVWGALGDERALREWRRCQDAVLDAMDKNPDDASKAAGMILDEQKKRQLSTWVSYKDLHPSTTKKS